MSKINTYPDFFNLSKVKNNISLNEKSNINNSSNFSERLDEINNQLIINNNYKKILNNLASNIIMDLKKISNITNINDIKQNSYANNNNYKNDLKNNYLNFNYKNIIDSNVEKIEDNNKLKNNKNNKDNMFFYYFYNYSLNNKKVKWEINFKNATNWFAIGIGQKTNSICKNNNKKFYNKICYFVKEYDILNSNNYFITKDGFLITNINEEIKKITSNINTNDNIILIYDDIKKYLTIKYNDKQIKFTNIICNKKLKIMPCFILLNDKDSIEIKDIFELEK